MHRVLFLILYLLLGTSLFAQAPLKRPAKPKQQKTIVTKPKPAKQKLQISGTINGHDYVDLGLPSGLKWATCNVGATRPEEFGDYFAWGEIEPKKNYSWSTYKYCKGTDKTLTKYCTNSSYGIVDNMRNLESADDVAHARWGGSWRMPTSKELDELENECTWTWIMQNGVKGRKVTGPNGNSIFLPAAGSRYNSELCDVGIYGNYWSSSLGFDDYPDYACTLYIDSEQYGYGYFSKEVGYSVRAVVR